MRTLIDNLATAARAVLPFPSEDEQLNALKAQRAFHGFRDDLLARTSANVHETLGYLDKAKPQIFKALNLLPADKAFEELLNNVLFVAQSRLSFKETVRTFFWEAYALSVVPELLKKAEPEKREYIYNTTLELMPESLKPEFVQYVDTIFESDPIVKRPALRPQ